MDALDKYKKAWDNQPKEENTISKVDIYKMAHAKSSSIVKWIFIIGILEFILLNSLYFFVDMDKANEEYDRLGLKGFVFYSQVIAYAVLFYFLIRFYLNYKSISVVESTKTLMTKILKTRKTVRHYVLFNLAYVLVVIVSVTVATLRTHPEYDSSKMLAVVITAIIFGLIMLGIIWLFYQLLYGILLRKLNKNYKELAKLDELK
ncbi:conserved membrane protein of unknown function [Tenacibaculum sp. 190130A14a]|uniref:Beta-carotene 15,15'-monooxygenase n=1 Tax=Tenacibaculum polynesiense TaxID=3137857 RepID=A0ABM9P6I6_9FLAO